MGKPQFLEIGLMPMSRVQPEHYEALLTKKVDAARALMAPFFAPAPQIYPSQPAGFRLRAEFKVWHESDTINYVMFRSGDPKTPIIISEFPIADLRIQQSMPLLRKVLNANSTLRHKLFQVEFLASLSGEFLVTLIYHRPLDQAWETAAQGLANELQSQAPCVSVIGRSRKQKLVVGNDFIQEVLSIHGKEYRYRQYEQSFSQPNGMVNMRMIEWACERAHPLRGDLLELYCGNGNFTLPLSQHFENVIATEMSKTSIRAARTNLKENCIENVQVVRMSAEEVTQAMSAQRIFRRLSDLPKALHQYDLGTLFVDPPRAGLDELTVTMASQFPSIIYVSCNAQTLVQNLQALNATHQIEHFALFDQFPYTDHMECGIFLQHR